MPARYTLHGVWASGPTYKVGLMLALAGEPFDYVHVDLREGEHKQPGYLAKQRFGQVPLLIDNSNGRRLCQSASIIEYLADAMGRFGGASLDERIAAREWILWGWDKLARGVYRPRGAKAGFLRLSPEVVAHYEAEGRAALEFLDARLGGRRWVVGEGPTIADVDLYGVAVYAPQAGHDLSRLAGVSAWMRQVEALPGYAGPEQLLPKESRSVA